MTKPTDFVYSTQPEPHRIRTKNILKEHPEIRNLIGRNPVTILAIIGLVAFQVVMAIVVRDLSWWWVVGAAYLLGAFADHSLFVMIHECAHNLLFKKKAWNTLAGIFSNLPQLFPSSVSFQRYHIKHHSFQGIHELDADLPDLWEAKLINNSTFGKAIWLLIYPVFQAIRVFRMKEIKPVDGWVILNWLACISFGVAMYMLVGPKAFYYLLFSFFFSVGLHPLGGRWIQEHYLVNGTQETFSYYGPLNTVAFNVGYHNEHHDFPSVPWNKLPKVKSGAASYYDSLVSHKSWTLLFLRFLYDKNLSLYSRMVRKDRGKVALTDESIPDADIVRKEKEEEAAV